MICSPRCLAYFGSVFVLVMQMFCTSAKTQAANGTWTQTTSGGLWSNTANWSGGTVADANGSTAFFNTINITADNTVHLDSARTITTLNFGDTDTSSAASWILDNNGNSANILTVAGSPFITVNALGTGATATISAEIAGIPGGGPGMIKNGAGTLVLSGANTFTRPSGNGAPAMSINAGTVIIASNSAFGATTGTDFLATGLLSLNGTTATLEASGTARTVANPIWLNNNATVTGSLSITFSGTFSGRGGSRSLTNNITGGGTLSLTNNVYTDWTNTFQTITFAGTGNTLISGVIANNTGNVAGQNGRITKSDAGTLTLSNTASTYTGATTINGGVVEAAALANGGTASSIGQSTNAAANLVFGAPTATLRYTGSTSPTIDRGFTLSSGTGGGATIESSGSGTLTIDNTVALAYGTTGQTRLLTLGGTNTGANTFSKVIADNGLGATSLTKAGAGQWVIGGTNSYTGVTNINAGTLLVNGVHTGGGVYTVANNATLGGSGVITSSVNIQAGGHLAPGNSIGTIATGALTVSGTYDVELGTPGTVAAPGLSDRENVTGTVTLNLGSTLNLIDNANAGGQGSLGAGRYQIITHTGARSGTFTNVTGLPSTHLGSVLYNAPGVGVADGVLIDLFDHAQPSFSGAGLITNTPFDFTLDFGAVDQNSLQSASLLLSNLVNTPNFTASLDLDSLVESGDDGNLVTGLFTTDLTTFLNQAAGSNNPFTILFDTSALGSFSADYVFTFSDQDLLINSGDIGTFTIHVQGLVQVVPEPATLAVWSLVGLIGSLGFRRLRKPQRGK